MKSVVLCADDFGLSEAVNNGILKLAKNRRLSAISCMTAQPFWQDGSQYLKQLDGVAVGLHFDLTENNSPYALLELMKKSVTRRLDVSLVRDLFLQQLDNFESTMGRAPDFIDGHQHVHQFPQVRNVILEAMAQHYPDVLKKPWLRLSRPLIMDHDAAFKALVLRLVSLGTQRDFQRYGFKCNSTFSGMYSLSPDASFSGLMMKWLQSCRSGVLMMCHPAVFDTFGGDSDPVAKARQCEFDFLNSRAFSNILKENSIELSPTPLLN